MSNNHSKRDEVTFKPNLSDIEMVFGKPGSPNSGPDLHFITNERNHNKHKPSQADSDLDSTHPAQPLLEPDKDPPKPPLAGPEIDDLDDETTHFHAPYPGIDDGLFEPIDKDGGTEIDDSGDKTPLSPAPYPGIDDGLFEPIDKDGVDGDADKVNGDGEPHSNNDEGVGTDDGKWWPSTDVPDHPYDFGSVNGLEPRYGVEDRPFSPQPDLNTYQQKKNLAQGMMDLALLSANANQLRYVLESSSAHPYFYPSVVFIAVSIVLQIAVGVGLIMNSRYNMTEKDDIPKGEKVNNMTVLGVFLVTIVNVFITSFSVASPPVATGMVVTTVQQAG